jgi:hypothetical protein
MSLCNTQGGAHAPSTEKDMKTEGKDSKSWDGKGGPKETQPHDSLM